MIRQCEICLEQFDNKRKDAGINFCPKCLKKLKENAESWKKLKRKEMENGMD